MEPVEPTYASSAGRVATTRTLVSFAEPWLVTVITYGGLATDLDWVSDVDHFEEDRWDTLDARGAGVSDGLCTTSVCVC